MDVVAHFKSARNILAIPSDVVVFHEGEPGKEMYVLLSGTADISVGGEVVETARAGSLVGEMALINPGGRSATVITRSDCKFVAIDTRQFDMLVRESPEFARHVMEVMAERLRRMNDRLTEAIGELAVRGRRPRH